MIPDDWIEHRRGIDGERIGWMAPEGEGFAAIDLLGRRVTRAVEWLAAEEALDALGIGYLADPYELRLDDGTWLRVRITEATPERIRVQRDDWGDAHVSRLDWEVPFPMPDRLRAHDPSPAGGPEVAPRAARTAHRASERAAGGPIAAPPDSHDPTPDVLAPAPAALVAWRGVDDGSRIDRAAVRVRDDGLTALGGATCDRFATSWRLEVDGGWITRELRVSAHGASWSRALVLRRDDRGTWSADATSVGDPAVDGLDLRAPGLAEPDTLRDALDCDLGLCPVTNIMPIRRLGLLERAVPPTPLAMAWVEVPSLRVIRSDQIYGSEAGPGRIAYRSLTRNVETELEVDADGLVGDYPGLALRVRQR